MRTHQLSAIADRASTHDAPGSRRISSNTDDIRLITLANTYDSDDDNSKHLESVSRSPGAKREWVEDPKQVYRKRGMQYRCCRGRQLPQSCYAYVR